MSGQWVEVKDEARTGRPFGVPIALIVVFAFGLLAIVIAAGVIINRSGEGGPQAVTIAELRADPDGYDGKRVELLGSVERRYTLPVLDEYGLYEFRDETGTMWVLTDKGVPPEGGEQVRLTATFNGAVKLDEQVERLVKEQFGDTIGSLAGSVLKNVLPGIPLNVFYLNHERYEVGDESGTVGRQPFWQHSFLR